MANSNIIKLLESENICKDLKVAYSFMLLSRGYSAEDIKLLDNYVFSVRKKENGETAETKQTDNSTSRNKQRSLPKNPVCLTSTSTVYNNKDHTLYSLNDDAPVTKGRLVWSIVKKYQQENNPTFEEVSLLFNNKLNLLRNTVINEASLAFFRPDRLKRFYYHESDIIESKDHIRYAVSNQWTVNKMDEIITFAQSNGWNIKVIKPLS